jgi:hypothetical protein
LFDSTEILGINRWIKPMKFAISIAIYLFTLAAYLFYLEVDRKIKSTIANVAVFTMSGELFLIVLQVLRGTTSHFNITSYFNRLVFALMAILIIVNTVILIWLTYLYFSKKVDLPKAVVWGLRLGLLLCIIGSLEGGYMVGQMSHSVGVPDGGAGLPFVNWSTEGGDLRIAHFLGLHGLQAVPIASVIFIKWFRQSEQYLTVAFAIVYFAIFNLLFIQAVMAIPIIKEIYVQSALTL